MDRLTDSETLRTSMRRSKIERRPQATRWTSSRTYSLFVPTASC